MTWTQILSLLQTLLIPVLVYGLYRLDKIDDALIDIRAHGAKLNGRITTCEALRVKHEENDERQHDQCEKRLETVERKLMGT